MTTTQDNNIVIVSPAQRNNAHWRSYFDVAAALEAVAAHIAALPGSRTPEQHTRHVYEAGLRYWLDWASGALPTADLVQAYIAHLVGRGLKSSTIGSKYLAPLRLFLGILGAQPLVGFIGSERDFISDCRDHINAAARIRTPRAETTTNVAPLWRADFVRLDVQQVNRVLRSIDRSTLIGLRDYALLHIAFSSALRLAELQRITLASFSPAADGLWLLTVRGKRSNVDPVPISAAAMADVQRYVTAWNDRLIAQAGIPAVDDPRYLRGSVPLWQPLLHGDNLPIVGVNRYSPDRGLSGQGLRGIIERRTGAVLGDQFALAAHDTRRTAAAIAYDAGMSLPDIQGLLRHKDAAVTLRYIGQKPDMASRSLAKYVTFG